MDDETDTSKIPPSKPYVAPLDDNDLSGKTLGGYRLVRKMAQGGMGVVYEAIQINLDRKVALKILTENLAARPEFLQRFEREAKAAAALNHPNIVQVHDFGEADGRRYIIMEYIDGENLSSYIERHDKIPIENALAIVEQAALGLKAAAGKSIVHRDVKPSNLLITRDGRVKVADLGLAKIMTQDTELTLTSASIGSPHFIAPEQAGNAKNADYRVDIYSLGVTLLFLLTGKYAYDGDSPISIVVAHATKPLPSGAELGTELPPEIEALIGRMAAKNPDDRYQNYDELLADLQRVGQGYLPLATEQAQVAQERAGRKRIGLMIAGAAVLLAAVGAVLFFPKNLRSQVDTMRATIPDTAKTQAPAAVAAPPSAPKEPATQPVQQNVAAQPPPDAEPPMDDRPPGGGMPGAERGSLGFPLPMGPPPRLGNAVSIRRGSPETMLAAADDYAQKNPENYREIVGNYRQIQRAAGASPIGAEVRARLQKWNAAQARAVNLAIQTYQSKMNAALKSGGPQAAYNVWKDFPSNLRSRESDVQIVKILQKALGPKFAPENPPAPQ